MIHRIARLGSLYRYNFFPTPVLIRRFLRLALTRHSSSIKPVILDIGAGISPYASTIRACVPGASYISADLAASAATTVVADSQALPFISESAGCVLALEVLQHIPKPWQMLEEARRVMQPGGILVITGPFLFGECDVRDFWRWTMEGLTEELARHGFSVITSHKRGGVFFALATIVNMWLQHLIPGTRRSWRARKSPLILMRALLVAVITFPIVIAQWFALALDAVTPDCGIYSGFMIAARRTS